MSEPRELGEHFRTARNLATDALRREQTYAQALPRLADEAERDSSPTDARFADVIGDEPLRRRIHATGIHQNSRCT